MSRIEAEQELDGRWIAEVSTFPGAMAYGVTQAEASEKALAIAGQSAYPSVYPWRSMQVGEEFEAPYCARCIKALIKQAEKSTRRKFSVVSPKAACVVRRIS